MTVYKGDFLDAKIVQISSHYLGEAEGSEEGLHRWPCPQCKVGEFRADGNAGTAGCTREGCGLYGSVDAVKTIARFEDLNHRTQLMDVLRKGKQILGSAAETAGRGGALEGPVGSETAGVTDEPDSQQGQTDKVAGPEHTPAHYPQVMLGGRLRIMSPEEVERIREEQAEREVGLRIQEAVEKAREAWWEELKAEERKVSERNDQSIRRVLEAYSWVTPVESLVAAVSFWLAFLVSYWLIGVVDGPVLFVLDFIGISRPEAAPDQRATLWDGLAPFLWEHGRALISTVLGFCGSVYFGRDLVRNRRRKARLESRQYVAILTPRRRKE